MELQLGEVIQKFIQFEQASCETYHDAKLFNAPSECYALIGDGLNRDLLDLFEEMSIRGWPKSRIAHEIRVRGISHKWLFYMGISYLTD